MSAKKYGLIPAGLTTGGFTLVELLVVVTIIVILLALLVPAMDKAIYQAELTLCGTKQHGLGLAVTQYASDFKRHYPYRPAVAASTWPMNLCSASAATDDRPTLKPYMSLNKMLNCPLIPALDMESPDSTTYVFGTENYWWGFGYRDPGYRYYPGMHKLGDRLEYTDAGGGVYGTGVPSKYSAGLLTSTRYVMRGDRAGDNVAGAASASHPDDLGTYVLWKFQDAFAGTAQVAGTEVNGYRYTTVRWDSNTSNRGTVDLNATFGDLSTRRYNRVQWDPRKDERVARVPSHSYTDGFPTDSWESVPKP